MKTSWISEIHYNNIRYGCFHEESLELVSEGRN